MEEDKDKNNNGWLVVFYIVVGIVTLGIFGPKLIDFYTSMPFKGAIVYTLLAIIFFIRLMH